MCGRRKGPSLTGRDWIRERRLDWKSAGMVPFTSKTEALLDKYADVSERETGNDEPALVFSLDVAHVVMKPALLHLLELDQLEAAGAIQKAVGCPPPIIIRLSQCRRRS